jgi:SAM-dependent methyltransferase
MKQAYSQAVRQYREDDERDVLGKDHQKVASILTKISSSFDHPISVLDAGCGTGRYFHCLKNTARLIGMDVSDEMLDAARNPVKSEEISARQIDLIRGNLYTVSFPAFSFDLIFSIGMFGNGCPVTVELCNKLYDWLKPGGYLFFDTLDFESVPWPVRLRKRARQTIYSLLPERMQNAWDEKSGWLPFFITSQKHLGRILKASKFRQSLVSSIPHQLTTGSGRKLECLAVKEDEQAFTVLPKLEESFGKLLEH